MGLAVYTDDEFNDKAAGFYQWCTDNKHLPLPEWFPVFMGVCSETVDSWRKIPARIPAIKMIEDYGKGTVVEGGATGALRDAMSIFWCKNHGMSDKQELSVDANINISIAGLDELTR